MINIQFFGPNFRVSDISSDEIITDVPFTDADPVAVKVPVNTSLIDETQGGGSMILLNPMKNTFTEVFPVAEFPLEEILLNGFGVENNLKDKTSPLRTMLSTPVVEEICLRPSNQLR